MQYEAIQHSTDAQGSRESLCLMCGDIIFSGTVANETEVEEMEAAHLCKKASASAKRADVLVFQKKG